LNKTKGCLIANFATVPAEQLNRKLKGWAMFYQFVDFKAKVLSYIDRVVFWKLAHWLAPQIPYRYRFPDEVVV
jgi:hypothetical protein